MSRNDPSADWFAAAHTSRQAAILTGHGRGHHELLTHTAEDRARSDAGASFVASEPIPISNLMTAGALSRRPLRVLIAEDEAVIGLDLAERLVEAGHSVLGPFTHCAEVREWIAHNTPDAAILDFKLLDGSCEETVRRLRDRGVPMIAFASGGDIPEDLADMVVVTKPGQMDQVLAALKRLTGR